MGPVCLTGTQTNLAGHKQRAVQAQRMNQTGASANGHAVVPCSHHQPLLSIGFASMFRNEMAGWRLRFTHHPVRCLLCPSSACRCGIARSFAARRIHCRAGHGTTLPAWRERRNLTHGYVSWKGKPAARLSVAPHRLAARTAATQTLSALLLVWILYKTPGDGMPPDVPFLIYTLLETSSTAETRRPFGARVHDIAAG
jgi:hypothetical protein